MIQSITRRRSNKIHLKYVILLFTLWRNLLQFFVSPLSEWSVNGDETRFEKRYAVRVRSCIYKRERKKWKWDKMTKLIVKNEWKTFFEWCFCFFLLFLLYFTMWVCDSDYLSLLNWTIVHTIKYKLTAIGCHGRKRDFKKKKMSWCNLVNEMCSIEK